MCVCVGVCVCEFLCVGVCVYVCGCVIHTTSLCCTLHMHVLTP